MTKQEEIREGIFYILQDVRLGELSEYEATIKLQELGVVIKVDRELPWDEDVPREYNELACGAEDDSDNIARAFYIGAQEDILKAGYVAVEPLIAKE